MSQINLELRATTITGFVRLFLIFEGLPYLIVWLNQ